MGALSDQEKVKLEEKRKNWEFIQGTITTTSPKIDQLSQKKKYGIRINADLYPKDVNGFTWFNGFGSLPGETGDEIGIYFERSSDWFNIKEVTFVNKTYQIPSEKDREAFKSADHYISQTNKENTPETIEISKNDWSDTIREQNRAILMKCSVDLCIARGLLSDKEIKAQYSRLMTEAEQELNKSANEDTDTED